MPRTTRLLLLVLVTTALLAGPATPASASVSGRYERRVTQTTNEERTSRDLARLRKSKCLDAYAERQARAMARREQIYHQDLAPILKRCRLRLVGKNVAVGYRTGAATTAAWMDSPGHRRNLLHPTYRRIGVGAYRGEDGRWYVAQVLGRRR
ncbi:MAG: CAP domain-containing protein [Actinomycetes bacterium]